MLDYVDAYVECMDSVRRLVTLVNAVQCDCCVIIQS